MGQLQARAGRCGVIAHRAGRLAAALGMLGVMTGPLRAQSDQGYATQPFTPKTFRMPDGEGCAGDVARWKAIQDNDYASGNIGLKVYHQIAEEIARADAACRSGQDAASRSLVHDSRRRHGYPG